MNGNERHAIRWLLAIGLAAHIAMIMWSAWVHSPALDEVAHLPAGISYWEFRDVSLYCVNPPLVKMIAALPVVWMEPELNWSEYRGNDGDRPEFEIGRDFIRNNPGRIQSFYFVARCALMPFTLVGALSCYAISRDMFGARAGVVALWLWCFSPNILANASMVTPDIPAASMGLAASCVFRRSLEPASSWQGYAACVLLGGAILCKLTNVVLIPVWIIIACVQTRKQRSLSCMSGDTREPYRPNMPCMDEANSFLSVGDRNSPPRRACQFARRFVLSTAIVLYVVNLGYGFQGTGTRLGQFQFVSRSLGGSNVGATVVGNRFANTVFRDVPVLLPAPMLMGIDLQKRDFERGMWSYLAGEHRFGGWWYYYVVALLLKVPLPIWGLSLWSVWECWRKRRLAAALSLLLPAAAVLLLVSSQTGFSRYLRYLLPGFGFAFAFISQVAVVPRATIAGRLWRCVSIVGCLAMLTWQSVSCGPHWMSYFNQLAGGSRQGHRYLIDANIDWGQDLYFLRDWCKENPNARPLWTSCYSLIDPAWLGCPTEGRVPRLCYPVSRVKSDSESDARPGWIAVSVHEMREQHRDYEILLQLEPDAICGASIYLFDLKRIRAAACPCGELATIESASELSNTGDSRVAGSRIGRIDSTLISDGPARRSVCVMKE